MNRNLRRIPHTKLPIADCMEIVQGESSSKTQKILDGEKDMKQSSRKSKNIQETKTNTRGFISKPKKEQKHMHMQLSTQWGNSQTSLRVNHVGL